MGWIVDVARSLCVLGLICGAWISLRETLELRARPLLLAAAAALAVAPAGAQSFPVKPVRLVVPFPPGGVLDTVGRTLALPLSGSLGQNVIVDNRPGASTIIGAEAVTRAPADGHTVLILGSVLAINAAVRPKLPYNTLKDFAPVARLASSPLLLSAHPSLPAKSLKEVIALARTRPGELTYATSGAGTPMHLAMETFKGLSGADLLHVPYQGGPPAAVATMGGHTSLLMLTPADVASHVAAGKLRALAVTSAERSPVMREVPTFAESGFAGFDMTVWFAAFLPAATPRDIVNRLSADMIQALQHPEVRDNLSRQGYTVAPMNAASFDVFFRNEVRRYEEIAKKINFRID